MPSVGYAPKSKMQTISSRAKPIPASKYTTSLPNHNKLAKAPQAKQFVKGGRTAKKLEPN